MVDRSQGVILLNAEATCQDADRQLWMKQAALQQEDAVKGGRKESAPVMNRGPTRNCVSWSRSSDRECCARNAVLLAPSLPALGNTTDPTTSHPMP